MSHEENPPDSEALANLIDECAVELKKELVQAHEEWERKFNQEIEDAKNWQPIGISGIFNDGEVLKNYSESDILDGIERHKEE